MSGEARFRCGGCGSVSDRRRSRHDLPLDPHAENRLRAPARWAKALCVMTAAVAASVCVTVGTENMWLGWATYAVLVAIYWTVELEA